MFFSTKSSKHVVYLYEKNTFIRKIHGELAPILHLWELHISFVFVKKKCFWLVLREFWNERSPPKSGEKMKFSVKDCFRRCGQIWSFLRIWSHLPKKSLMENLIFCAVINALIFVLNLLKVNKLIIKTSDNIIWRRIINEKTLIVFTARKTSKYGDFSGPYFPVFLLNSEIKSPYSVKIRENTEQKNSVFGHFYVVLRIVFYPKKQTTQF